jgi:hypothetical protein
MNKLLAVNQVSVLCFSHFLSFSATQIISLIKFLYKMNGSFDFRKSQLLMNINTGSVI